MIIMVIMVAFFVHQLPRPNSSLLMRSMIPWLAPMVMFSRLALGEPRSFR